MSEIAERRKELGTAAPLIEVWCGRDGLGRIKGKAMVARRVRPAQLVRLQGVGLRLRVGGFGGKSGTEFVFGLGSNSVNEKLLSERVLFQAYRERVKIDGKFVVGTI